MTDVEGGDHLYSLLALPPTWKHLGNHLQYFQSHRLHKTATG